jgi:hypothetical protein
MLVNGRFCHLAGKDSEGTGVGVGVGEVGMILVLVSVSKITAVRWL